MVLIVVRQLQILSQLKFRGTCLLSSSHFLCWDKIDHPWLLALILSLLSWCDLHSRTLTSSYGDDYHFIILISKEVIHQFSTLHESCIRFANTEVKGTSAFCFSRLLTIWLNTKDAFILTCTKLTERQSSQTEVLTQESTWLTAIQALHSISKAEKSNWQCALFLFMWGIIWFQVTG